MSLLARGGYLEVLLLFLDKTLEETGIRTAGRAVAPLT